MADLLIDTDVFIGHLRGTRRMLVPGRKTAHFSVITRCELLSGRGIEEEAAQRLLGAIRELPVDRATAERAALCAGI